MMRRPITALALIAIAALPLLAQRERESDADRIASMEKEWAQAYVSYDVAVLQRVLASDFLGTWPDGRRMTKAQALDELKRLPHVRQTVAVKPPDIHLYGDAAVSYGEKTFTRSSDGRQQRFVFTDIWVKRHGAWQAVASQDVVVPSTQGTKPR